MPSLQKSDGNLQDAPRIKNCLKAALLPFEFKTPPPATPSEIREKAVSSVRLHSSCHTLIFLFGTSAPVKSLPQV